MNSAIAALGGDSAHAQRLRFLMVGGFNTAFGYCVSVALYALLNAYLHIVVIGVIINIICISLSFLMYKLFVFRSGKSWLKEYLRSYVVYGGSALIGIGGLWLFVNILHIRFWIAQGVLMALAVAASYVGHKRFTFRQSAV